MNEKLLIIILMLCSTPVFASETVQFPASWSPEVSESAQKMVTAGMSREDTERITQLMIRARFQEREILAIQQMLTQAGADNEHRKALKAKFHEEIEKRTDAPLIIREMERMQTHLYFAERIANDLTPRLRFREREKQRERLRQIIGDCMAAGLQAEDVQHLAQQLRVRTRTGEPQQQMQTHMEAFLTARELVRTGVKSKTATALVGSSLEQNYTVREMEQMRSQFRKECKINEANFLAQRYITAIRKGFRADNLTSLDGTQQQSAKKSSENRSEKSSTSQRDSASSSDKGNRGSEGGSNSGGKGHGRP